MSLLIQTSPKHCANRGFSFKKLLNKKLLYALSTFISTIFFIILLFYLILHPSKPHFFLQDATVSTLSLSSSNTTTTTNNNNPLLNSTIQLTLLSQNPNSRVGVYYDRIRAYAIYKGQQITADSDIPPFYQGHEDASYISTELYGNGMPLAAGIGYEVARDQTAGKMVVSVRVDGVLRWKVGSWVSGKYRFDVDCVVLLGLGGGGGGGTTSDYSNSNSNSNSNSVLQGGQCSINV